MAKEKIRSTAFRPESLARIEQMSDIIDEYQQQGLTLTARQLYYQCVSRDLIANTPREYQKLTALLTDARYAGLVDWDAIEDRGREPNTPSEWPDVASLVESALRAYRLPRWDGQLTYVELWVEKQALAGVLEPLAREAHATLMVNKGYSSASAMKQSADRIKKAVILDQERWDEIDEELNEQSEELGVDSPEYKKLQRERGLELVEKCVLKPVILYLGDHDPSGEDMVRDIGERLKEFGVPRLVVEKIGLTIAQVKQYNPPPNPAKLTDSRAKDYVAKFGSHSWEVDALPPQVLTQLVRRAFAKYVDKAKVEAIKAQEVKDKDALRAAAEKIMKKR